jgi:hypothetical protein
MPFMPAMQEGLAGVPLFDRLAVPQARAGSRRPLAKNER